MNRSLFFLLFVILFPAVVPAQVITTIAGDGTAGYNGDSIAAVSAKLHYPQSIAVDKAGNIFIGDIGNSRIRKISTSGIITTYGGTGQSGYSGDGGPATAAALNPAYLAVDNMGYLYITDPIYNRVRVITPDGIIRCIAGTGAAGYSGDGGPAIAAMFNRPSGLVADDTDNIYVADNGNNCIRKITYKGIVSTIAGGNTSGGLGDGGPATAAQLSLPDYITIDPSNNLYVCSNRRVRRITKDGVISTYAGSDTAKSATIATGAFFFDAKGITADAEGNIYVVVISRSVRASGYVVKINPSGILSPFAGRGRGGNAGDGGPATNAMLSTPAGLAADKYGRLYIADYDNHNIRRVASSNTTEVSALSAAGDEFNIYPNPTAANGILNIIISSQKNNEANVVIIDMAGKRVVEYIITDNTKHVLRTDLVPGNYIVIATTETKRWCRQIEIK